MMRHGGGLVQVIHCWVRLRLLLAAAAGDAAAAAGGGDDDDDEDDDDGGGGGAVKPLPSLLQLARLLSE